MPFWKCYYHLIWSTKHRAPIITETHERLLMDVIPRVAGELDSHIYALGGIDDHIHVAASIPPKIALSDWVQRVKGASSNYLNQHVTHAERFRWQRGYGVLTFGVTRLDKVVGYIQRQKEHHAQQTTITYLETMDE